MTVTWILMYDTLSIKPRDNNMNFYFYDVLSVGGFDMATFGNWPRVNECEVDFDVRQIIRIRNYFMKFVFNVG